MRSPRCTPAKIRCCLVGIKNQSGEAPTSGRPAGCSSNTSEQTATRANVTLRGGGRGCEGRLWKLERSPVCSGDYSPLPPVIFHIMQMFNRLRKQLVHFSCLLLFMSTAERGAGSVVSIGTVNPAQLQTLSRVWGLCASSAEPGGSGSGTSWMLNAGLVVRSRSHFPQQDAQRGRGR